jgi:uncharacterized membrane protein YebE (DUF533 family)
MDAVDTIKILGSLLGSGGLSKGSGNDVLGNLLGSVLGGASEKKTQGGDMLGDLLSNMLGSGQSGSTGASGGNMGDLLGSLLGGGKGGSAGGLGDLIGGMLGGGSQTGTQGGNMGDLLGSLLGGEQTKGSTESHGDLGGLLGGALSKYAQAQNPNMPNPQPHATEHLPEGMELAQAEEQARLIIRAMINAAKSDGRIDQEEQDRIIAKLGDLSEAEKAFLREEFNAPLDVEGFIRSVPKEMQTQIYAVSLAAIDLDTNHEAQYLAALAQGFGFSPQFANELHERLGAPKIFSA